MSTVVTVVHWGALCKNKTMMAARKPPSPTTTITCHKLRGKIFQWNAIEKTGPEWITKRVPEECHQSSPNVSKVRRGAEKHVSGRQLQFWLDIPPCNTPTFCMPIKSSRYVRRMGRVMIDETVGSIQSNIPIVNLALKCSNFCSYPAVPSNQKKKNMRSGKKSTAK